MRSKKKKFFEYLATIEQRAKEEKNKEQKKAYIQILNHLKGLFYILFNEFYIEQ